MKEKNGQRKFEGCQLIDSEVCIIQSSKQVKSINLYICLSFNNAIEIFGKLLFLQYSCHPSL